MNDERPRVDRSNADRPAAPVDLTAIERDLAGVEAALARLDDGTYWTDELTLDTIPDEVLVADPVARRGGPPPGQGGAPPS